MKIDFSKLLKEIDPANQKKTFERDDAHFWRLKTDESGNGSAVIRFLPDAEPTNIPYFKFFKYAFKNPKTGRWYIENSPTTISNSTPDPVYEANGKLTDSAADVAIKKLRKRKVYYLSNILVVKDPANPENNGKVFPFQYGQKIYDKIMAAIYPDEALGEESFIPFDPVGGADFLLKQTVVGDFPNFDQSKFSRIKPITDDEDRLAEILSQCYSLKDQIKIKPYDILKKNFDRVNGVADTPAKPADDEDEFDTLAELAKPAAKPAVEKKAPTVTAEDDDEAFFKSLLND
jgi:hypothetical protein